MLDVIQTQPLLCALALGWACGSYLYLYPTLGTCIGIYVTGWAYSISLTKTHSPSSPNRAIAYGLLAAGCAAISMSASHIQYRVRQSSSLWTSPRYQPARYLKKVTDALDPRAATFTELIVAGQVTTHHKKELPSLRRALSPWGLDHIIARSGLHIYILIMCSLLVGMLVPWWHARIGISFLVLIAYSYIFPPSVSCARALLLSGITTSFQAAGISIGRVGSVILGGLLVSLWWPWCWISLGTWLSFGLSIALMVSHAHKSV